MKLYSVEEVANELQVTTRTIRNYLKEGRLQGTKVGGQWRFSKEDLYAFIGQTDLMEKKGSLLEHYLTSAPVAGTDLLVLTCSFSDHAAMEVFRDTLLTRYNQVYSGDGRRLEYQFIEGTTVRVILSGPFAYLESFGSWINMQNSDQEG